ncbi:MAG: V-type ATP synthase subunit K [Kiritimatiellae bacterium]|nr:V-type ATP synthase subunit K [Kiritimatiellia bacterium]
MDPELIQQAMGMAGAVACLGLSATGSAFGTGFAATSAVGAWKKCYAQNKPAPFILLGLVGAPITQTLYGMILMFLMFGKAQLGLPLLILGIFAGLGIGMSAFFQGRAAAAACDAQAETGQGFTNYLAAIGIVETVAIFTMVFALIAISNIGV